MSHSIFLAKKVKSLAVSLVALTAVSFFAACGGDDSPAEATPDPVTSSESLVASSDSNVPASSAEVIAPASSGAEIPVTSSATAAGAYTDPFTFYTSPASTGLVLAPDTDGFYAMADVYKAVPQTSKIAFVIRHSKRYKSTASETAITPIGQTMAKNLGASLASEESFHYASTNVLRTRQTCELIAEGRGETADVVTWDSLDGSYFLTVPTDSLDSATSRSGGSQKALSRYAYGVLTSTAAGQKLASYFYDQYERGNQFVNEVILANMANWSRVSVLVTHDVLIEPLVAFVSDRTIDLKFYQSPFHWVNYLSGVAVIEDANSLVTVLPVKGDSVGWMIPAQEVNEEVE